MRIAFNLGSIFKMNSASSAHSGTEYCIRSMSYWRCGYQIPTTIKYWSANHFHERVSKVKSFPINSVNRSWSCWRKNSIKINWSYFHSFLKGKSVCSVMTTTDDQMEKSKFKILKILFPSTSLWFSLFFHKELEYGISNVQSVVLLERSDVTAFESNFYENQNHRIRLFFPPRLLSSLLLVVVLSAWLSSLWAPFLSSDSRRIQLPSSR